MSILEDEFESKFGFSIPPALAELFAIVLPKDNLPIGFRFDNVPFVLELQNPLDCSDAGNCDLEKKRLAFAVTPDGHKLLVDLSTQDLNVLQDEFDDIDAIGVTVHDLLAAERYSL